MRQRLAWPAARVHFNDLKARAPQGLLRTGRVSTSSWDALRPPADLHGRFSTIVTDPPWGEYEDVGGDYGLWAQETAAAMARLLRPEDAVIVLLTNRANEDVWASALAGAAESTGPGPTGPPLGVEGRIPLLVNGHPASAVVARRRG